MKLHLVDGTYELFRSFYGPPSRRNGQGQEVGAARALASSLLKLISHDKATHIGIAFDTVIRSFRNDLFAGYKTGEGIDEDLHAQFPLAEDVARALGFRVWSMHEFEADDAIATAAFHFAEKVEQIIICSPDKDMAQCVQGDKIVCLDRMRERSMNEAGVVEKFGVRPASIPDYLALVGDSADGIPGIARWGSKGTAAVLGRYGHLANIPKDVAHWDVKVRGAKTLSQNLEAARDQAKLYVTLATLRRDVPLATTRADLQWQGADRAQLEAVAKTLELGTRFFERIPRWRDTP
jgi:5'-3' exonuclease